MAENDEVKALITRAKAAKVKHDLHVLLLQEQYGLKKPDAMAVAYVEGVLGLKDRLPKPPAAQAPAK